MKHTMECKNIANIMYVLCVERRKCKAQQQSIIEDYEKKIKLLQSDISQRDLKISSLNMDRDDKIKQLDLREECLLEILRQYQKFINFALRAAPTQAEFLLNIEKMMIFELTQAVAKTDRKHATCLAQTLHPWKSDSGETSIGSEAPKISLTNEIWHDCLNILEPPTKSSDSIPEQEYLPAFYYDNRMYVREDFRNMMSQGIRVSPSNLIWNRDVEHLMQILRRSVCMETPQEKREKDGKPERLEEQHTCIRAREMSTENQRDILHPIVSSESSAALLIHYNDAAIQTDASDISLKEPCCKRESIESCSISDERIIGADPESIKDFNVPLIGATNSLEIVAEAIKERKKSSTGGGGPGPLQTEVLRLPSKFSIRSDIDKKSVVSETNVATGILCAVDSLEWIRKSITPTSKLQVLTQISELPAVSSKTSSSSDSDQSVILRPRDSLPIHRMSLMPTPSKLGKKKTSDESVTFDSVPEKSMRSSVGVSRKSILKQPSDILCKLYSEDDHRHSETSGSKRISPEISESVKRDSESKPTDLLDDPSEKFLECKDSLEIIRSRSRMSRMCTDKLGEAASQLSIEIKNEILAQPNSPMLIEDAGSKSVTLSHIEILPPTKKKSGVKSLDQFKKQYNYKAKVPIVIDSPWLIYGDDEVVAKEPDKPKKKLPKKIKKTSAAKIVGDQNAKEHLIKQEDFTLCRVNSMMSIFKKHPSLVRIFTSCTK